MKKIVCLILCLVFAIMMCACSPTYENGLFSHNYERDYKQVIIKIDSITESNETEGNEKRADGSEWSYTSDVINIYKLQLVNFISTYGSTYMNYYGMTIDEVIDYAIEQLVLTELIMIQAEVKFESHEIFWTKDDIEEIQRSVYASLDDYLNEIYDEILEKNGLSKFLTPDTDTSSETTYPVKTDESDDSNRFLTEESDRIYSDSDNGKNLTHDEWYEGEWYIEDDAKYWNSLPGNYGDEDTRSLCREGVNRLISMLAGNAKNIIGLTDDEQKKIEQNIKDLKECIKEEGVAVAYQQLGKTLLVKKLIGESIIMSKKMDILQEYIENIGGDVEVTDNEILEKYNRLISEQVSSFAVESNYDSAATGKDLVLYRANGNYVYVKHILIPFSNEQKAKLEAYKKANTEDYERERNRLVNNIVAYEHINGEDDLSNPKTVDQIWSEINDIMSRASASAYEAERAFDDLIYKYNTDPGIFGSEYGYAVKYKLGEDENETYMAEFAECARAFRDEGYSVGQIYDKYIVTDYGVHIMYYAADYKGGEILDLRDYTTPAKYTLVKDKIKEDLRTSKVNAAYDKWRSTKINYYRVVDNKIELIEKAYKDLYDNN